MRVLVTYASRYGSTRGIAERIAVVLREHGLAAQARSLHVLGNVDSYAAYVVGSAVYMGHWQSDAKAFVKHHQALLAERPTWLYSSGPLGTAETDAHGRDVRIAAQPAEIEDIRSEIRPRDHRVFFGAFGRDRLRLADRVVAALPATRELLPEGDFRDWAEIDDWARGIAAELAAVPVG